MIILLLGVSGCGKTTIGQLLARELNCPFLDADDFHPPSNLEKMGHGIPLTDADRWPWLEAVRTAAVAKEAEGRLVVVACSALKQAYRVRLTPDANPTSLRSSNSHFIRFVHLHGPFELVASRLKDRRHFMPPSLLASQFADLEPPSDALRVDIDQLPSAIVREIREKLGV